MRLFGQFLEEVQSRVLYMMRKLCDLSFRGAPFGGGLHPLPLGPQNGQIVQLLEPPLECDAQRAQRDLERVVAYTLFGKQSS